jgi:hypothetical protein
VGITQNAKLISRNQLLCHILIIPAEIRRKQQGAYKEVIYGLSQQLSLKKRN